MFQQDVGFSHVQCKKSVNIGGVSINKMEILQRAWMIF